LRLSSKEDFISRNSHVEVNKPDTHKRLQAKENILSRIYRYFSRIAYNNGTSFISCQISRRSSHIGSNKYEQAAKTIWTINTTHSQLRDSTASIYIIYKRKRTFHSSVYNTKGSSDYTPLYKALDNNKTNPVRDVVVKPAKVANRVGVTTILTNELEQYRKPEHYNLIKFISDPLFLVACYEEIAKKKGNTNPGSDGYTIDGLN